MSVADYPNTSTVGQTYLRYLKRPPNYDDITVVSKFEDQGADMLQTAASPPQIWELDYDGLTEAQAKVLDDHYASANGQYLGFQFVEPRNVPFTTTGSTFTDVHYFSFEKSHGKYWTQARKIVLIKRPA